MSLSRSISQPSREDACLGECLQKIRTPSRHDHSEPIIAKEDAISPVDENTDPPSKPKAAEPAVDEPVEARIERLGRERPKIFRTIWSEMGFVFSVSMSQILAVRSLFVSTRRCLTILQEYFISGFNVILPTLVAKLHIPSSAAVWPASAFSLVVASTLLVFGRVADMFGGKVVYLFGLAWLSVWSIIAGFSQNQLMLDFCRALQGIGPAAFLPSGVMLMGSIYRPGPRKNLVFSIYGTCAVVGFFTGIFFSGVVGQYLHWGWYFWIGAFLAAITTLTAYFAVPSDYEEKRKQGIKMDWMGAGLIVSGLVLFVFSITDSSHAPNGWKTPYVYILLIIGYFLLGAAIYVEGWVAKTPLLPFDLFCVPYMKALIAALFLVYGCLSVYLLYGTF
jgi:MFS family permease